jgi:SynChlorMet cassette protein ScmC
MASDRPKFHLKLADGSRWKISGGDVRGAAIVSILGRAMELREAGSLSLPPFATISLSEAAASTRPFSGTGYRLLVLVDSDEEEALYPIINVPPQSVESGSVVCRLYPYAGEDGLYAQLLQLSLIVVRRSQIRGGVLLHGALAARDGAAAILAAPGGRGKTTASKRLGSPWYSLSDDATLVVRDALGTYRAHPWPTWSRFVGKGREGSWKTQCSFPLEGIFFLDQDVDDRIERVGPGRAVSMLVESAAQVSSLMKKGLSQKDKRSLHMEWFENLCNLARAVPSYILKASLTGAFWREIEKVVPRPKGQD